MPTRAPKISLLVYFIVWCTATVTAGEDQPSPKGFAAKFAADQGIAHHPAVIFADDFESGGLPGEWDSARNRDAAVLSFVDLHDEASMLGRKTLRTTAVLGQNTGGGLTKWFPSSPTLFIRYYTKFASDCDYIHHFGTLRANTALQGKDKWSGFGGAGKKPSGDERFSTALEPWGNWGRWKPPGRWNFYSYWHEMKASPDANYWGNAFRPEEQSDIKRGKWICTEFMLKHNTPGQANGEQAFWIDGRLAGHWKGINWRKNPKLEANAFTLESYVTDRWTKQVTNIVYFDNVVIAKEYIGPVDSQPQSE